MEKKYSKDLSTWIIQKENINDMVKGVTCKWYSSYIDASRILVINKGKNPTLGQ